MSDSVWVVWEPVSAGQRVLGVYADEPAAVLAIWQHSRQTHRAFESYSAMRYEVQSEANLVAVNER